MTSYVVTSHGADFFGEDRHPLTVLEKLAAYTDSLLPRDDIRGRVYDVLANAHRGHDIDPGTAGILAGVFGQLASHRALVKKFAVPARLLALSAARAAAEGETWTWRTANTEGS